jgi:hypothetical protein
MKVKLARVGLVEKEHVMMYCTSVEQAVENARLESEAMPASN